MKIFSTLIILTFFLILPSNIYSQSKKKNQSLTIQEQQEQSADILVSLYGIPINSKIRERYLRKLQGTKSPPPSSLKKRTIIKHLQFDSGIQFPTKKELAQVRKHDRKINIVTPPEYKQHEKREKNAWSKETIRKLKKKIALQRTEAFVPKKIPICSEDKVETYDIPRSVPSNIKHLAPSRGVLFDTLYLPKSAPKVQDMQTGVDELFGKGILVHTFSTELGDYPSLVASKNNITCLPFRLRVTNGKIFRLYGKEALKKYKKNSKGKVHEMIATKLNEFFNL